MTDRELLELAAKAAGRNVVWRNKMHQGEMREGLYCGDTGIATHWNPLTDDGDALRLAVKLRMMWVFANAGETEQIVMYAIRKELSSRPREPLDADPYAATRRAIVRAAAEIGRTV